MSARIIVTQSDHKILKVHMSGPKIAHHTPPLRLYSVMKVLSKLSKIPNRGVIFH